MSEAANHYGHVLAAADAPVWVRDQAAADYHLAASRYWSARAEREEDDGTPTAIMELHSAYGNLAGMRWEVRGLKVILRNPADKHALWYQAHLTDLLCHSLDPLDEAREEVVRREADLER